MFFSLPKIPWFFCSQICCQVQVTSLQAASLWLQQTPPRGSGICGHVNQKIPEAFDGNSQWNIDFPIEMPTGGQLYGCFEWIWIPRDTVFCWINLAKLKTTEFWPQNFRFSRLMNLMLSTCPQFIVQVPQPWWQFHWGLQTNIAPGSFNSYQML